MKALLIIVLISSLLLSCPIHGQYTNAGECTDEATLATAITSTTTLGTWLFGWTTSVPKSEYCTHDAFFAFNVTYTLGTGDTASLFVTNQITMTYNSTSNVCDENAYSGTQSAISTNTSVYTENNTPTNSALKSTACGYTLVLGYTGTNT